VLSRSWWPCVLRSKPAAASLLRSRVRISLRAWMFFFSCVCWYVAAFARSWKSHGMLVSNCVCCRSLGPIWAVVPRGMLVFEDGMEVTLNDFRIVCRRRQNDCIRYICTYERKSDSSLSSRAVSQRLFVGSGKNKAWYAVSDSGYLSGDTTVNIRMDSSSYRFRTFVREHYSASSDG